MTTTVLVAMLAVLGVAITAGGTWLVARRQTSGRIDTSEAATLWEAAEQIRAELRAEVGALREQVAEMRAQAVDLLAQIDRLEQRLARYERPSNG